MGDCAAQAAAVGGPRADLGVAAKRRARAEGRERVRIAVLLLAGRIGLGAGGRRRRGERAAGAGSGGGALAGSLVLRLTAGLSTPFARAESLAIGDFDGDSNLDLAVASPTNGVFILLGDGNGGFLDTHDLRGGFEGVLRHNWRLQHRRQARLSGSEQRNPGKHLDPARGREWRFLGSDDFRPAAPGALNTCQRIRGLHAALVAQNQPDRLYRRRGKGRIRSLGSWRAFRASSSSESANSGSG
jgi:hypothetical protein